MTDQIVTRLYRALVEELRQRSHEPGRPVKVSELYQTLVPYRSVRSRLGVELNADYEYALLRLLAGERDLLRLESEDQREELRKEVEAPYPFVGLFRKFSASNVWVEMPEVEEPPHTGQTASRPPQPEEPAAPGRSSPPPVQKSPAAGGRPRQGAEQERSGRLAAETDTLALRAGGGAEPAPARPAAHLHPPADSSAGGGASERLTHEAVDCAFCGDPLPVGRRVRFCPHCGGDQRLRPCPRCEAVLERSWRYCIRCGHEPEAG